ncbi:hypothetical protein HD554DRAFT_2174641 [Boletus coccyginus]|nr:hypothetical protein HD554DRAFT_2174641 [Boletus coccyginus]
MHDHQISSHFLKADEVTFDGEVHYALEFIKALADLEVDKELITFKQFQYEECKEQYEELVKNNARFYESATKSRELYVKGENLQQKKERYQ